MEAPVLPSDKELEELIRQTQESIPDFKKVPKACMNCMNWIPEVTYCPINDKLSPGYMVCNHHKSKVQHLVEIIKKRMLEDATENKKIEYLLSVALSLAEMTAKVFTNVESRVKKMRDAEKDSLTRSALKKDLDLCETMEDAYDNIAESLREAEKQYNLYVLPHYAKAFKTKDGKFDVVNSDKFTSDSGEFIEMLLKYHKGCFLNDANSKKVFDCLDGLENDQYFPLTEKDMNQFHVEI